MWERITAKRPWLLENEFEIAILGGWEDLVVRLLDEIGEAMARCPAARFQILQIKEKFGGLRFYYELHEPDRHLLERVRECREHAEDLSWVTCEQCGQPGQLRQDKDRNWFWVRCDAHAPEGSKVVPQTD